jgi:hypothetical protein
MKLPKLSTKQKIISAGVLVALVGVGGAAALNAPQSTGADTSPLVQEVDRQGQELDNHEARITNTESDVKDLQNKTATSPATTRVVVPSANTTPTATSTNSAPAPVTVTKSSYSFNTDGESFCNLTYSDGTKSQVVATVTAHTVGDVTESQDNCASFIGQLKG